MSKIINLIGMTIIASKYALLILLAGITLTTGASAADPLLVMGFDGND